MMHFIVTFFTANRIVISFAYPLMFFLMGFGILLKDKDHSRFDLTNSLNYLGLFGIAHSFSDWGSVFIPLQGAYLNHASIAFLTYVQIILKAVSFSFLLFFGVHLLQRSRKLSPKWLIAPIVWFGVWIMVTLVVKSAFPYTSWVTIAADMCNYVIALPSGVLAGYSIYVQRQQFADSGIDYMKGTLTWTTAAILFYTVLVGSMFLYDPAYHLFFRASNLTVNFFDLLVEALRAIAGFLIFVLILRILHAVDIEYQQYFQEAERNRTLTEERNRIARDLHDGMIQSIYANGLHLESVRYGFESGRVHDVAEISRTLSDITKNMNGLISELRGYIANLKLPSTEVLSLEKKLRELIEEYHHVSSIPIQFVCDVTGEEPPFSVVVQMYYILKEALSNALKHAHANAIAVSLTKQHHSLILEISDDGVGFRPEDSFPSGGFHQGIRNMIQRAKAINGQLVLDPSIGHGTTVQLRVPMAERKG